MAERNLSCFLCRELLYEFAADQLDGRRKASVNSHLTECDDCPRELKTIMMGQDYSLRLANTEVTRDLIESVSSVTPVYQQVMSQLKNQRLTTSLKWAAEALVVAGLAAVSFNYFSQKIFLNDREREAEEKSLLANAEKGPDEVEVEVGDVQTAPEGEEIDIEVENGKPLVAETPFVPPTVPLVLLSTTPAVAEIASTPIPQGFVYRAVIYTEYLDQVTPEIVGKIEALGGKRAGKVALGWRKDNESYFHFTLPGTQQNGLIAFLKTYSSIKVDKDSHPRVMPPGMVRFILRVVSTGATTSSESPEAAEAAEAEDSGDPVEQ